MNPLKDRPSAYAGAVTRQDKYPSSLGSYAATSWHKQLTSTNDTEAQYPLIKVVGVAKILLRTWVTPAGQDAVTNGDDIVTIETGHVFVAKSPEQFTYDEDGNLLSDGRWEYTCPSVDGSTLRCENGDPTSPRLRRTGNRLVSMETATNKVGTTVPVVRLEFVYDYQGRRVSKSVSQWVSNQWDEISDSTFIYDGFNLVREVGRTVPGEPSCETNVNYFVFGLDLSGSLQGAGGVGGLLAEIDDGDVYFPCFDANGNVSEYVSTNGTIVAHREYSPYGKTLVSSGTKKSDFTHWFSTKPFDQRSGLYSYIFRYYDPDLGRWPSRDPVEELGGINLQNALMNAPVNVVDLWGFWGSSDWDVTEGNMSITLDRTSETATSLCAEKISSDCTLLSASFDGDIVVDDPEEDESERKEYPWGTSWGTMRRRFMRADITIGDMIYTGLDVYEQKRKYRRVIEIDWVRNSYRNISCTAAGDPSKSCCGTQKHRVLVKIEKKTITKRHKKESWETQIRYREVGGRWVTEWALEL